jgi:thioredoxin reductase (NADPH)
LPAGGVLAFDFDCAIIGGGPGGLVTGIYLRRFQRRTILINGGIPRAAWIPKTHNLIGYEKGISGPRLMSQLRRQFEKLNPEMEVGRACIFPLTEGFRVQIGKKSFKTRKVVLATGIEDVQPPIPNVRDLRMHGLLRYCPICDAYEYRSKKITVLARDEHGLRSALFLSAYTQSLRVVVPTAARVSPSWKNLFRQCQIDFRQGDLLAIEREKTKCATWIHLKDQDPFSSDVNYVLLGANVHDSAFKHIGRLKRTREGFLLAGRDQRLSIRGIFGVGDCVSHLAQISVAAGHAAVAATKVHQELREETEITRPKVSRPRNILRKVMTKTKHDARIRTHSSSLH